MCSEHFLNTDFASITGLGTQIKRYLITDEIAIVSVPSVYPRKVEGQADEVHYLYVQKSTAEENFDGVQDDGITEQQPDDIGMTPEQTATSNFGREDGDCKQNHRRNPLSKRIKKLLSEKAYEPEEDEEMDISDDESLYENEDENNTEYVTNRSVSVCQWRWIETFGEEHASAPTASRLRV
eukprot:gene2003-biopygen1818